MRAAAIRHDGSRDVDALLHAEAERLKRAGRRVRGLLMTYPDGVDGCRRSMVMVDIAHGQEYLVSQPLGAAAAGCRADPQGFAQASRVLRDALHDPQGRPDILLLNRFGGLEAEGGGFREELLALLAEDVPLLTAVGTRHMDAWMRFTGGTEVLDPTSDAIAGWVDGLLRQADSTSA